MTVPEGEVRDRSVVTDLGDTLADALEHGLTGYLRIETDGGLLSPDDATVLTLEDGVPVAAMALDGTEAGADALAEAAVGDLYRIECHALAAPDFQAMVQGDRSLHADADACVSPDLPAEQLAGDNELAARTRDASPSDHPGLESDSGQLDAVASFLEDEETIASIRERARSEAKERAQEWGFAAEGDDISSCR